MMEIQQHDGVVVEVVGFQQDFAKRCGRREKYHGREREAPRAQVWMPSLPSTIYRGRGEGGGAALPPTPRKGCG